MNNLLCSWTNEPANGIQTDMNYNELLHPLKLACPSYNLSLLSDDLQRYGVLARNHC